MKPTLNSIALSMLLAALLCCLAGDAKAGRPQPYEYVKQYRQANMVVLQFQEALASKDWERALTFCSQNIRDASKKWESKELFFEQTTPLEKIVDQYRFGYWKEGHGSKSHSYGMLVRLTTADQQPLIQWFWSISTEGREWLIDWEPEAIDLDAMIQSKLASQAARKARIEKARVELEAALTGIKTHLSAKSTRFVVGSPMVFKLELFNFGDQAIQFKAAGVAYEPLRVTNAKRELIPCLKGPAQLMVSTPTIPAKSSTVLAETIDLNKDYQFSKPGTYYVQYDGRTLRIGKQITIPGASRFDNQHFVASSTSFPSNILMIEVVANDQKQTALR